MKQTMNRCLAVFLSVITVVTLFAGTLHFTANAATNVTAKYEQLFGTRAGTKEEQMSGYTLTTADTSFSGGGQLLSVFDDAIQLSQESFLILPTQHHYANFVYEVDFNIDYATADDRWVSFMYRANSDFSNYMQMCVRHNATLANGVEMAYWDGANWGYHSQVSAPFDAKVKDGYTYTARIVANGSNIKQYLNGVLLNETTNAKFAGDGYFGIQSDKAVINVQAVRLLPLSEFSCDAPVRDVYEPNTGMVGAPTVIQYMNTTQDVTALSASKPAQGAWFTLADANTVKLGNTTMLLTDVLRACQNRVVPVFHSDDSTVLEKVGTYLKENGVTDVMVASANKTALALLYAKKIPYLSLAYIATGDKADIANDAHRCGANTVVLNAPNQATVDYLQARFLSVTVKNGAEQTTKEQVRAAVSTGAYGVVVNSAADAYTLYEEVNTTTYIRKPYTVAHRGYSAIAPDNSMAAFNEAFDADADAVECDVWVTSDGQLVVFHNATLQGCTTDGATDAVESLTLAQLQAKTLHAKGNYGNEKIPSLAQMFEVLAQKPDKMMVVEIKTGNTTVSEKIKTLAEQYGVLNQINIIAFDANQCLNARKAMPTVGVSLLIDRVNTVDATLGFASQNGITYSPSYLNAGYSASYVRTLARRGIGLNMWTIPVDQLKTTANKGAMFMTTNDVAESVSFTDNLALFDGSLWEEPKNPVPGVTLAAGTFAYDGTPKNLKVAGTLATDKVTYENNGKVKPGVFTVKAIVEREGYDATTLINTLTVTGNMNLGVSFHTMDENPGETSVLPQGSDSTLAIDSVNHTEGSGCLAYTTNVGGSFFLYITTPDGNAVNNTGKGYLLMDVWVSEDNLLNAGTGDAGINIRSANNNDWDDYSNNSGSQVGAADMKSAFQNLKKGWNTVLVPIQTHPVTGQATKMRIYFTDVPNLKAGTEVKLDDIRFVAEAPSIQGVTMASETFVYDGTQKHLTVDGIWENDTVTYQNNGQTEMGTYTVTATVKRKGYQTLTLTATLNITQPEEQWEPGDVNMDGSVDAKDALAALKHAVGKPTLSDDLVKLGDLNGDGILDAKDALTILKIAVGMEVEIVRPTPNPPESPVVDTVSRKFMTFNILTHVNANPGIEWTERANRIANVMRSSNADCIGVQEATPELMGVITQKLADKYDYIGEGREGGNVGEYSAIFYLKEKYTVLESDTFWLSETPDTPSKGWDSDYYRICTWGVFQDKSTGAKFAHINSHFDHKAATARENSVQMVLKKAKEFGDLPVVFTADMNTQQDSDLYNTMIKAEVLYDTKTVAATTEEHATIHRWGGTPGIIDYVMVNNGWVVDVYDVISENIQEDRISDHYPVCAEMRMITKK